MSVNGAIQNLSQGKEGEKSGDVAPLVDTALPLSNDLYAKAMRNTGRPLMS